jgi:RNA methyltransferase, TrmH family
VRVLSVARDLQRRHARERQGLFVAEGVRTVDELLRSSLAIRGALIAPPASDLSHTQTVLATLRQRGVPIQEVTGAEFASAADTETPQGILAIAEVPKRQDLGALPIEEPFRLVVLDAVQDPGNVGTIVRTAAALGAAAIVTLPGTVDLWNAKVVRSSMGALFHHPTCACTWEELTSFRSRYAVPLWGADATGEPLSKLAREKAFPRRLAVAVGNEGGGLGVQTRQGADLLVSVEIASTVESLNVAVAMGILLYELR